MQNVDNTAVIDAANALPGRLTSIPVSPLHAVHGHSMTYIPEGMDLAFFAMGCFWGAERLFWQQPGVYSTAAGYSGGHTPNPTYHEVCSGRTGHAEVVRVFLIPPSSAISSYCRFSGKITIQHKGCVRAVMSGHNTARLFMS